MAEHPTTTPVRMLGSRPQRGVAWAPTDSGAELGELQANLGQVLDAAAVPGRKSPCRTRIDPSDSHCPWQGSANAKVGSSSPRNTRFNGSSGDHVRDGAPTRSGSLTVEVHASHCQVRVHEGEALLERIP